MEIRGGGWARVRPRPNSQENTERLGLALDTMRMQGLEERKDIIRF